jgi:glutathione S-transferase
MKLYGTPPTRAVRAQWLINELEIDCEIIEVDFGAGEHQSDAIRSINPACKVPFLVDGDAVITESCAIQLYLAEKFPDKGLMPHDVATRAQVYRWMFFLATEIEAPLWRIALHEVMYEEHERSAAEITLARRDAKAMIEVLEDHMRNRRWLVGEALSVVDLNAAYTLDWADEAGLLAQAPRLKAFVVEMYARPKAPPTIARAFAALREQIELAGPHDARARA